MPHLHPLRWLILFGVWLIYATFGLIATSLAPLVQRIESDLDISHAAMGSVMGAWQLVFIAAALPCGMLLDRLGSRWALLLGAASIAASAWGRAGAEGYAGMLLAVMLFGVGGPIISSGAPKVIASWFDGADRGLAMGIYITGPAVGAVAALSLTHAWLMPLFDHDWRAIFRLWAVLAALAGVSWFGIASLPPVRALTDAIHAEVPIPHRRVVRMLFEEPAVRLVLLMSVGVFMLSHGIMNWLPELLVNHGMSLSEAGYWAALPTLVGILSALTIPRLATPERRFVILVVLCTSTLLAAVLLQFHQRPLLIAGLVMQGVARTTLLTVLILTLVELPAVGQQRAGTASGLFFSAAEFGGMLGPLSLGVLYDMTHGFATGLAAYAVIAVFLIAGAGRLRRMAAAGP